MDNYSPKGYITFVYESDGIHYIKKDLGRVELKVFF